MVEGGGKEERQKKRKKYKSLRKNIGVAKTMGRRIEDMSQNAKDNKRRRQASRKMKEADRRARKEDKKHDKIEPKTKYPYRDTRETRLKDKAKETRYQKGKKLNREERKELKDVGVSIKGNRLPSLKKEATPKAKRAKKALDRMDNRKQRKIKHTQNEQMRKNRMDTKESTMSKGKKKYEKDMRKKGIDVNKKVRGLTQVLN